MCILANIRFHIIRFHTDGGVYMKREPPPAETLVSFREATMELDNVYSMFSKKCGLSEAEYWSLVLIYEGAATQSEISSQLFMSRQTLNSAFKQLRKKGLIDLEHYEENLRSKRAFLTDAGKKFVNNHVVLMYEAEEKAWEQLSTEERDMITRLTRKFSGLIRQELGNSKSNNL